MTDRFSLDEARQAAEHERRTAERNKREEKIGREIESFIAETEAYIVRKGYKGFTVSRRGCCMRIWQDPSGQEIILNMSSPPTISVTTYSRVNIVPERLFEYVREENIVSYLRAWLIQHNSYL